MTEVLLSHSYYYQLDKKQWDTGMPYPPLGTIYAASLLRENNFEINLFDVGLRKSPEEIIPILDIKKPKYLVMYDDGFNYLTKMCLSNMREASFKMIGLAKKAGCKVIVSSSDSTDHYKKYLEKGADVVLLGEGELSLLDTLNVLEKGNSLTSVKGIVYKEKEELHHNGRREVIKNLDELPPPAWDLIDVESYKKAWTNHSPFSLNIATTRGCPYKCNWCAKPIYGNRYNSRSPQKVVDEIKYLSEKHQVTNFWMCDDIFGLKPNWVQGFDEILKENNLKISYKIQSRADLLLKQNTIDALVNSGLREVWIGAESGSQGILDAMDKGTSIEQIESSTTLLQQQGVRVAFFIQYGYLGETKNDIDQTLDLIRRAKPDDIGISISYPLPGTKFYEKVKEQLIEKQNWTDSNDLAMMFSGTFNPKFYKKLHSYTHKAFQVTRGKEAFKNSIKSPKKMDVEVVKKIIKLPFYWLLGVKEKLELSLMKNKNGN